MNTIINLLIKGFGAKLVRHGLLWLVGIAAAHGIALDPTNIPSLLISLAFGGSVIAWSMWAKAKPDDDVSKTLKDFIGAVIGALVPVLFGYLNSKGYAFGPETDLITIGVTLLSVLASQAHRPDNPKPVEVRRATIVPAVLVLASLQWVTACQTVRNAKMKAEINEIIKTSIIAFMVLIMGVSCSSIHTGDGGTINAIGSSGSYKNPTSQINVTWDNAAGFSAAADSAVAITTPGVTSVIVTAAKALGSFMNRLLQRSSNAAATPATVAAATPSGK